MLSQSICPAVETSRIFSSIPSICFTTTPASSNRFFPLFCPMNFSGSEIPTYTVLIALPSLRILSTHVRLPLSRSLHGSMVVYNTVFGGRTSPIRSSGRLCFYATLMKQHCSACVLPGSPRDSRGSSKEYPVDKISFLSASTRTAPTQNLVFAGGDSRALLRAYSIYAW